MDSDREKLLAIATDALRRERDVRLAVLFGSTATGEDRPDSDVDLLIVRRSTTARAKAGLSIRLSQALCKRAHLVDLEHAESSPALLADVLLEGRPLIDRDGLWRSLLDRREEIISHARAAEAALAVRAREAVLAITAGIRETDRRSDLSS
jgi:predicted nucleotidyltransferase